MAAQHRRDRPLVCRGRPACIVLADHAGQRAGEPGTAWSIAGTGDFNGDGLAEILWRRSTGEVGIWEMDGTTQLVAYSQVTQDGNQVNPGTGWDIVGTGDYNGDGMTDILWSSPGSQLTVWTMNGFERQSSQVVNDGANPMPLPPGWQARRPELAQAGLAQLPQFD